MPCASCTLACLAGRILARKPRCDACDCHLGVRTGQSRPSKYHACTCCQSRTAICGVTKAPLWGVGVARAVPFSTKAASFQSHSNHAFFCNHGGRPYSLASDPSRFPIGIKSGQRVPVKGFFCHIFLPCLYFTHHLSWAAAVSKTI